jgi:Tat protein translocase TatB subunit
MLDLGMQELVVIFVVALVVFGPKRLPELARALGKGVGQARKAIFDIKSEVEKEVTSEENVQVNPDVPSLKDGPHGEDARWERPGELQGEAPAEEGVEKRKKGMGPEGEGEG